MQLGPLQINKWNRNWYVRWLTMIWFELDDRPHRGSIRITTINLYYLLLHCVSLLLFFLLLIHFCLRDVRWFCFAHDSSAPTSSFETLKNTNHAIICIHVEACSLVGSITVILRLVVESIGLNFIRQSLDVSIARQPHLDSNSDKSLHFLYAIGRRL